MITIIDTIWLGIGTQNNKLPPLLILIKLDDG